MTTNNGWPGKPGVPLNPDRSGAHILGSHVLIWRASIGDYINGNGNVMPPEVACAWPYRGPCLTPDEAAKREDVKWHEGYAVGVLDVRRGTAFGEPDTHYAALQARVAELEGALKDAAASVGEWGAYASQYFQDKWDLPGEVARYIAIAEGKNDAALGGKKDE